MLDIGYLAAFLGGVLALISPCSALLLPSFFAYAFGAPTRMLARTGVFFLGLGAVLVPLGAGSAGLAALLTVHRVGLVRGAGWVIIALGVVQIVGGGWSVRLPLGFSSRWRRAAPGCRPPAWVPPTVWRVSTRVPSSGRS